MNRVHIGIDENGLGARLGPLVVTAVGARVLSKVTKRLDVRSDGSNHLLDDSKRLVSHQDVRLGEAWARVIAGPSVTTPSDLLARIGIDPISTTTRPCPNHVKPQCWSTEQERFTAEEPLLRDVERCVDSLRAQGLDVDTVRSVWICTRGLNQALQRDQHRFIVDLHSMERLILDIHERARVPVDAVCGKVGGIADYPRYFGPLAGRLHAVVEQSKERGAYEFPGLGRIEFVRDADAVHPLVMIASLVGKYIRELFMARIARHHLPEHERDQLPSGYHDPVTDRFVEATSLRRQRRKIPFDCFERRRNQ